MRTSCLVVAALVVCLNLQALPCDAQEMSAPPSSPAPLAQLPSGAQLPDGLSRPPFVPPTVSQPATATPGEGIPSFSQLFASVGQDFRNLPSRENAILLTVGGGLAGLSRSVERDLTEDWSRPGVHAAVLGPGSIVGNSYLHMGAAFALYGIGRGTQNTRLGRFGADLARAQILAQSTTFALKFAADRTRPNGEARSFPSGHTSTMFATATVIQQHFGWKAGVPAFAAAAYVGAQRIQDSKHYLSDVAFGATLGLIAGRTVTIGHRNMKFALTPVSGPGGGVGVGFTRVK
jgi:membrane-associated phospholipid phosphatase